MILIVPSRALPCVLALSLFINTSTLANKPGTDKLSPVASYSSSSLQEFSGRYTQKKINLNWSLANTAKIISFEVERSLGGQTFIKIGTVKTNSKNKYQFTDKFIFQPAYYYRIKMIAANADPVYSEAISISQLETTTKSIILKEPELPDTIASVPIPRRMNTSVTGQLSKSNKITSKSSNLTFSEKLQLEMKADKAGELYVDLVSADNRVRLTRTFTAIAGTNRLELNELDYLPEGIYQIEIKTGKQVVKMKASK